MRFIKILFVSGLILTACFGINYAQDENLPPGSSGSPDEGAPVEEEKVQIVVSQEIIDQQVNAYRGNLKEIVALAENNLKKIDGDIKCLESEKALKEHLDNASKLSGEDKFDEALNELNMAEKLVIGRSYKRMVREERRSVDAKMKAARRNALRNKAIKKDIICEPKNIEKNSVRAIMPAVAKEAHNVNTKAVNQVSVNKASPVCGANTNFSPKNVIQRAGVLKKSNDNADAAAMERARAKELRDAKIAAERQAREAEMEARRAAREKARLEKLAATKSASEAARLARARIEEERLAGQKARREAREKARLEKLASGKPVKNTLIAKSKTISQTQDGLKTDGNIEGGNKITNEGIVSNNKSEAGSAVLEARNAVLLDESNARSRAEKTVPVDSATQALSIDASMPDQRLARQQGGNITVSEDIETLYRSAVDLYWGNKYDEARNKFEEVQRKSPNYSRTLYYLDKIGTKTEK